MTPRTRAGDEGGFIIVGVVMFVLALTILGLSLFSLSTTEAQFMGTETDDIQAYMSAMSGIQRAKWVITRATNGNIRAVKNDMPTDVVFTRAMYTDGSMDSITAIDWAHPKSVQILVVATHGAATRRLQESFLPVKGPEIYRHLLSISDPGPGSIVVPMTGGPDGSIRDAQTYLDGAVWQNSSDQSWAGNAQTTLGHPITTGSLPDPDVASYFAAHPPATAPPFTEQTGNNHRWAMVASAPYSIFSTPAGLQQDPVKGPYYTAFLEDVGNAPDISVANTAVWLVPHGVRFNGTMSIHALTPTATLIIVAQHNLDLSDEPDVGIWFFGGLNVDPGVSLFLVSDGKVKVEDYNEPSTSTTASYLSIFAKDAYIMGPRPGSGHMMTLQNPLSLLPNPVDPVLDALYTLGLLPNTDAGLGAQLQPIAGTWSEAPH